MRTREFNDIFTYRNLKKMSIKEGITLRKDAASLALKEIDRTDDVFKILDLMWNIFWRNHKENDLKLGRNFFCFWTYKSNTDKLDEIVRSAKQKIYWKLFMKEKDFLKDITPRQASTLLELADIKHYDIDFKVIPFDQSFERLVNDNFQIFQKFKFDPEHYYFLR